MAESKFLVYKTDTANIAIDVIVKDETIWATQKSMAKLFGKSISTINRHIKNIFESHELNKDTTIAKFATVVNRGIRGEVSDELTYYNLDMIISVGYRVNSIQATHFRQWATQVLKEYMIKGFALDDERLKQGSNLFDKDYFDELLERVRSIRTSERRIWQKVTDIFAEISSDYDKNSLTAKRFYATVQNKFHYAITGKTAAEIIYDKADHSKPNMGLTTWKNSPDGRILKSDTHIAKNYLTESQIKKLERNVSGYFDYIEDLIERRNTFTMKEFAESIDKFLSFREYKILQTNGTVSKKDALNKANHEYDKFNKTQKIDSDFDKQIRNLINKVDCNK